MAKRDKLNEAFKLLRKQGFVARQNFLCCQGCAGAQIHSDINKMQAAGKKLPVGYVFFHRQDTEKIERLGTVCLSFGNIEQNEIVSSVDIGRKICDVLGGLGLFVSWRGDANQRIEVSLT